MLPRTLPAVSLLIWLVAAGTPCSAPAAAPPEMRGMWVTRFEWPRADGNPTATQQRITEILDTLARHNFNAVFFQVRGQADVLYPSPCEPWSALIGSRDPGFDPLAYAIQEAHNRGLEFHAYINAFPCWDKKTPPDNPDHLFNKHPDWLCRNTAGDLLHEEYQYLSPGNPEVQAYVRRVILDVVKRYDVDGIHLDRIRYPSLSTSHDPVSEERFKGLGNPGGLGWEDWQRAQISGFCNDLYGQILALKPHVKVTAAVWGIYDKTKLPGYSTFSSGFHDYYQDSQTWIRFGVMDALVPMIYWDIGGRKPDYDELYSHFLANAANRHIYGGMQTKYDNREEPIREIEYTRSVHGFGTVGFSFTGVDNLQAWPFYQTVYAEKAPVPGMPWKSTPESGSILGTVRTPQGVPVADAWIRLNDQPAVWLSSADGVVSILNLPPSQQYAVTVDYPWAEKAVVSGVKVVAGASTPLEIVLQPAVPVAAAAPPVAPAAEAAPPVAPAIPDSVGLVAPAAEPAPPAAPVAAPVQAGVPSSGELAPSEAYALGFVPAAASAAPKTLSPGQ